MAQTATIMMNDGTPLTHREPSELHYAAWRWEQLNARSDLNVPRARTGKGPNHLISLKDTSVK